MAPRFAFTSTSEDVVGAFTSSVHGRTFAITGTSARGLGAYTATSLAHAKPAHLILISRNFSKVEPVIKEINTIDPSVKTTYIDCSLDDLGSVRKAAAEINAKVSKIDVLINNAGVMAVPYAKTKDGIEMTLAANHVGHFLLTNLIMDRIIAAGPDSRIVNVSSQGHKICSFRFDDHDFSGGETYNRWSAYGQSKTANILFTTELAKRLASKDVHSYAIHPGAIFETNLPLHLKEPEFDEVDRVAKANNGRTFRQDEKRKDLTHGTMTILVAALDPELAPRSGAWLADGQIQPAIELDAEGPFGGWDVDHQIEPVYAYAVEKENAEKLWNLSEEMVKQKFDY